MGSASEFEYQFLLARDLELLSDVIYEKLSTQIVEVKRMLSSLLDKVRSARQPVRLTTDY
jgi:four helix bundle protein